VLDLLPLALGSALYPTLLAMVVLILRRDEPRRILAAYLAGAMLTSIGVGLLVVRALEAGKVVGGSDHTVGPGVDIGAGLVAALVLWMLLTDRDRAVRERRRRKKEAKAGGDRQPWSHRILARDSVLLTFGVGMALSLPGALYLVALKDIAASDQTKGADIAQIVVYNVIMFAWAELPLIGFAVSPERTRVFVNDTNQWLVAHARQIAMSLCAIAAAALIIRGTIAAI
jgi:hypothetical protein